jgi:hypothetical protein
MCDGKLLRLGPVSGDALASGGAESPVEIGDRAWQGTHARTDRRARARPASHAA